MIRIAPTRRVLLALSAIGVATACGGERGTRASADKTIDKAEQTDPAPILRRTSGLPDDAAYLWFSGTTGSDAPGPSTSWIDARIEMTETQLASLGDLGTVASTSTPAVVPELAERLEGTWHEAPAIADRIAAEGWDARAWVAEGAPVLVLTLIGQG